METPPPLPPLPPPDAPPRLPNGSDKIWSVISHLSTFVPGIGYFIVPLVVYLVMKQESEYVACNAREALNFHISLLIYGICCVPLFFLFIGIPLVILIALISLIFSIMAAIKASEGGCYHYPLTIRLVQ